MGINADHRAGVFLPSSAINWKKVWKSDCLEKVREREREREKKNS